MGDTSRCPASCPAGQVCDGYKCINVLDCPCVYKGFTYQNGQVWKEDEGCTSCFCCGGDVECTPTTCDVTSCEPGYYLHLADGDCCPTCVRGDCECVDKTTGYQYLIGETWTDCNDECSDCVCEKDGKITCTRRACDFTIPTCKADEKMITIAGTCCPEYECICDESKCSAKKPTCPSHKYMITVELAGTCCPDYDCVCDLTKCYTPVCRADQRLVRVGQLNDCCDEYKCEDLGCRYGGVTYSVGEKIEGYAQKCSDCYCNEDGSISCTARTCSSVVPVCPGGQEPIAHYDEDGCCATYVCECFCEGYSGIGFTTFDAYDYTHEDGCVTHTLARDFGGDFIVSMHRGADSSVEYIKIYDCVHGLVHLNKDMTAVISIAGDETTYNMNVQTLVEYAGFTLSSCGQSGITMTVRDLTVQFRPCTGYWSVKTSAKYIGQTEGMCGSCDGSSANEFYVEEACATLSIPDFARWWFVSRDETCTPTPPPPPTCDTCDLCTTAFSSSVFNTCRATVTTSVFEETCNRVNCIGQSAHLNGTSSTSINTKNHVDYLSCSSIAAFAAKCDECVEWRTPELCPVQCDANMEFKSCGPSIVKTCDNYKIYDTMRMTFRTEGCFCPSHLVYHNGRCIDSSECEVCVDETGKGRKIGEQWTPNNNPCITKQCTTSGDVVVSAVICPPATVCEAGYRRVERSSKNACCRVYECVPENDDDEVCPPEVMKTCDTTPAPVCEAGEECKAIKYGENMCCTKYECECDKTRCPAIRDPVCAEGEELRVVNPGACCEVKQCFCVPSQCPATTTECTKPGYTLSAIDTCACCPSYECTCDKTTCPPIERPQCNVGEQCVIVDEDACCTEYTCICDPARCPQPPKCSAGYKLSVTKGACCDSYECVCDDTACPSAYVPTCPDVVGMTLKVTGYVAIQTSDCCPAVEEYGCVCDATLCPAAPINMCADYEIMISVPGECCPIYECICDTCPVQQVPTCDANKCLTTVALNECCNKYVCECGECAKPTECPAGFITEESTDDCGCIKRTCTPPKECILNGVTYDVGETWTKDACTTCCCSLSANGIYEAVCTEQACEPCQAGYTRVPAAKDQCCGECVPDSCVYNGKTYTVGQTWSPSDDTCSTCVCKLNPLNGEVYTQCSVASCPAFDESCPAENIEFTEDGCCKICKPTTVITEEGCSVKVDYKDNIDIDGCVSDEVVEMTLCSGECTSASVFSEALSMYHKQCPCCTATATTTKTVNMTCPDGRKFTHDIVVATECSCMASKCQDGN